MSQADSFLLAVRMAADAVAANPSIALRQRSKAAMKAVFKNPLLSLNSGDIFQAAILGLLSTLQDEAEDDDHHRIEREYVSIFTDFARDPQEYMQEPGALPVGLIECWYEVTGEAQEL